ncbi:MAG: hypothetical protein JWQ79_553 [Mucilaginibacter sp.]|nr:hypothetical protein [Mucilaginibacter sp.]
MSVLVCCSKVYAQQKDEYKTMIDSAITIKYTQFQEATKKLNNKDYIENLYLLNEQDQPLNYLPSSSKFKFITVYDDRNRKVITKGIYAWKVFTSLNQNHFTVTIVDFYITYKNHNYNFANAGGSKTIFEYQCDQKDWKLLSSENKGN